MKQKEKKKKIDLKRVSGGSSLLSQCHRVAESMEECQKLKDNFERRSSGSKDESIWYKNNVDLY